MNSHVSEFISLNVHYFDYIACILTQLDMFCAGYHAPLDLFMELNNLTTERKLPSDQTINVCIGKEWYRFPSSFFLPDNR
jgi:alpha-1,2-mannosyltransferase